MTRVVLDTNILVSATLWPGPPSKVYLLARSGQVQVVSCAEGEAELARVLSEPKFNLPAERVRQVLTDVRRISVPVVLTSTFSAVAEDPADDVFLRLAVDGGAEYVVTGDRHLLRIGRFRNIDIVTAADFLKRYEASKGPDQSSS